MLNKLLKINGIQREEKTETGHIGLRTFRKWSFCEDFTVETDMTIKSPSLNVRFAANISHPWVHFLVCFHLSSIVAALCPFSSS